MIRAVLMVAALRFPCTPFAAGDQEILAKYGEGPWSPGPIKSPAMRQAGFLPVETMVQAVPDQVAVLDFG